MIISAYAIPGKQFRDPLPIRHGNTPGSIIPKIKYVVLDYFGLTDQKVFRKTRKREAVLARQIMHYLARKHTQLSLKKIGLEFHHGDKHDHTTIRHSVITIQNLIETDPVVKGYVETLTQMIGLDHEEMMLLKNKTKFAPLDKPAVKPAPTKVIPMSRANTLSEQEKTIAKYL
jgi:hypothetical protein